MKKALCLGLLALFLLLSGCGKQQEDRHPEWDEDWTRFDDLMAIEAPENFRPGEMNDALAVNAIWYAVWNGGTDPHMITNAEGKEAAVYDAQIFLVLKGFGSEEEAKANLADWIEREAQSYETGEFRSISAAGQVFSVRPLLSAKAENPYARGAAAFAVRGRLAISAELLCAEGFEGDPDEILAQFLNGIHYGE